MVIPNRNRREEALEGINKSENLSDNGLHYSWDWDDVHFVVLGIYPADVQNPKIRYNPVWHEEDKKAFYDVVSRTTSWRTFTVTAGPDCASGPIYRR